LYAVTGVQTCALPIWQLFLKPDVAARAPSAGVTLQPAGTPRA